MNRRTEATANLKYLFTDEEKRLFAIELANKIQERDQVEDELKSIKSDLKSRSDLLTAQINRLSSNLRTGHEYRQTKCEMELNFVMKHRYYYDLATGEKIGEEPFREGDYQMKLELD